MAALDRGWGRPTQAVDLGGEMAINKIERVIINTENRSHGGAVRMVRICG